MVHSQGWLPSCLLQLASSQWTGTQHVVCCMQFMPQPVLKLQKSLRLPNSPLSLRLRYECPLEALDDPMRPPARFLVRCAAATI